MGYIMRSVCCGSKGQNDVRMSVREGNIQLNSLGLDGFDVLELWEERHRYRKCIDRLDSLDTPLEEAALRSSSLQVSLPPLYLHHHHHHHHTSFFVLLFYCYYLLYSSSSSSSSLILPIVYYL